MRAGARAVYGGAQIPGSAFGPCLTAVFAIFVGGYHLSRRKTRQLLRELLGTSVSLGATSAMEQRKALESAHKEPLREVRFAGIKHSDNTTSRTRSGKLMSLWTPARRRTAWSHSSRSVCVGSSRWWSNSDSARRS